MNTTKMPEERSTTQSGQLLYTAKAHTTGGRDGGASRTSDGRLELKFSVPGGPGSGTNPEQLSRPVGPPVSSAPSNTSPPKRK